MDSSHLTDPNGEQQLLQKLRDENAGKWERLVALHQHQHQHQLEDPGEDRITQTDYIQTEIDLLPRNELVHESNRMLRRLASNNHDELAAAADELMMEQDNHSYAASLVESFHQLRQTNAVLLQSITREETKLKKLQQWGKEHEHIQEALQSQQEEREERVTPAEPREEDLRHENQRLRDSLSYIADCIKTKHQSQQGTVSSQHVDQDAIMTTAPPPACWPLDQLVLELMSKQTAVANDSDRYLAVDANPVNRDHVAILHASHMLETFQGDANLIKLIAYL